jgi:hypothetical protein
MKANELPNALWVEDIREIQNVVQADNPNGKCATHGDDLALFCENCQIPICFTCVSGESHPKHSYRRLDDVVKDDINAIQLQNGDIESKLAQLKELLGDINHLNVKFLRKKVESLQDVTKKRDQEVAEATKKIDRKYQQTYIDIGNAHIFNKEQLQSKQGTFENMVALLTEMKNANDRIQENIGIDIAKNKSTIRMHLDMIDDMKIPKEIDVDVFDR